MESFREVRLDDPILALLLYKNAQNAAHDLPVPYFRNRICLEIAQGKLKD